MTGHANAPWQLEQASASARAWLIGLTAVLPVVIAGIALGVGTSQGETPGLAADSVSLGVVLGLGGVLLVGGAIGFAIHLAMRRHRVVVDADGLEVATTFYRRRLAWAALGLDDARVLDLGEHTGYKPALKSNGTALPGFRSGWFRLRNREKALVAMTSGPRVLWLPTTQGYGLLLQPRQPKALLDHLRNHPANPARDHAR